MKEPLLSIVETTLTRSGVENLATEAKNLIKEDPWFYGTLYLAASYLLESWDEQGVSTEDSARINSNLLQPFRDYIEARGMQVEERISRAGRLLTALLMPPA